MSASAPVVFVSHGAPTLALDASAGGDFVRLGTALPRPAAILVLSAHWLDSPATIGTVTTRPLYYDFSGFPDELYSVHYEAPPAASLADELQRRLPDLARDDRRPWDHGVWVPLLHMFPRADVPLLELSLPYRQTPRDWYDLGSRLAFLRDQNVLLLASGGAVHNLRQLDWNHGPTPPTWATEFESWLRQTLLAADHDALLDYRNRAPALRQAHPTEDHLAPLLVALGATAARPTAPTFPIEGWEYGSLSRLAIRWS